jgi:aspartate racemase
MSSNIVVGILAGMGPRSMISFLEKVIHYSHELYGAKNDSDYPNMLIYSLATPSYTVENIDHGSMKNCIQKGVESLKQAKVNYLAIPSNYAHTYYDFISSLIDVPVLNIVNETIKIMPKKYTFPALLATTPLIKTGYYQEELKKAAVSFFHDETLQNIVSELVISIKQTGLSSHSKKLWKSLYEYCEKNNFDSIISACTDLTPCLNNKISEKSLFIMDSTDALALQCVKKYFEIDTQNT